MLPFSLVNYNWASPYNLFANSLPADICPFITHLHTFNTSFRPLWTGSRFCKSMPKTLSKFSSLLEYAWHHSVLWWCNHAFKILSVSHPRHGTTCRLLTKHNPCFQPKTCQTNPYKETYGTKHMYPNQSEWLPNVTLCISSSIDCYESSLKMYGQDGVLKEDLLKKSV